jgi:Mrp family chromosome partitioning ATPase
MYVVGIAARKGGSGKTTLTSHLAVAAEAAGCGPVAVIDTDPQVGLAGWWNARAAETPRWIDPIHGLPAAAILLSQYGTVAPVMIHHRVDFAASMTDGRTAGELDPSSRSGAEIAALWTYLHNLLTEDERDAQGQTHAAE